MNFIEILLSKKLKEKNPTLDIFSSDRKVLQIASQDLINYLKVFWNLFEKEQCGFELITRIEKFYNKDPVEFEEFIELWTGMWLKKWNERVKLLIGKKGSERWNSVAKILKSTEPKWKKLSNRKEMLEIVTASLINKGEVCGTSILAENLLKKELNENKKEYLTEREKKINIVNNTLRKARELTRSTGPLIFVKIDKAYYR